MMHHKEMKLIQHAADLKQAFDHSFTLALNEEAVSTETFLTIKMEEDRYALRLAEISGLHGNKKITSLPGTGADLLGIATFRGMLVPIYDMRLLLGYSAGIMPHWLVLVAPHAPVGLAFDQFEGYLNVPCKSIARSDGAPKKHPYISDAFCIADQIHPVVDIASILESIKKRAQSSVPLKE